MRQHCKLVGSTYLDQDTSGTFVGPGEKPRTPSPGPSRLSRKPRSVSEPRKPKTFSEQLVRQTGKKHTLIISPESEFGKAKMAAVGTEGDNWPWENTIPLLHPDPPGDFDLSTLDSNPYGLRKRSTGDSSGENTAESSFTTLPTSTGETTVDGRPYPTIGHPAARGCKPCFNLNLDCTLLDDDPMYPCAYCEEGEEACELFIQPKFKTKCQNCKKAKVACSYTSSDKEEVHRNPCVGCQNDARMCCAGPRKGGPRLKRNSSTGRRTIEIGKSAENVESNENPKGKDDEATTEQNDSFKELDTGGTLEESETIDGPGKHDKVRNDDSDPLAYVDDDASDPSTDLPNQTKTMVSNYEDDTTCKDIFLQAANTLAHPSVDPDGDILGDEVNGAPSHNDKKEDGLDMPIDTHSGKAKMLEINSNLKGLGEEDEFDEEEEEEEGKGKDTPISKHPETHILSSTGNVELPIQTNVAPIASMISTSQSASSEEATAPTVSQDNTVDGKPGGDADHQKAEKLRERIIAENENYFGKQISPEATAALQSIASNAFTSAIIADKKGKEMGKCNFEKAIVEKDEDNEGDGKTGNVTPPKKRKREGDDTAGPSKKITPAKGGKQAAKVKRMDELAAMKGVSQESPPVSATESVFPAPPTTVNSKSSDDNDLETTLIDNFAAESGENASIWGLASRAAGSDSTNIAPANSQPKAQRGNATNAKQHIAPETAHGNPTAHGTSTKQTSRKNKAYKTPSVIDEDEEEDDNPSLNNDSGPSRSKTHTIPPYHRSQYPKATAMRHPNNHRSIFASSDIIDLTKPPTRLHDIHQSHRDHQTYPRGASTSSPALTFLSEEVEHKEHALWLARRRERRLEQEIQDAVAAMRGRSHRGIGGMWRRGVGIGNGAFGFEQGERIDLTDDTVKVNVGKKRKKGYTEIIELNDDDDDSDDEKTINVETEDDDDDDDDDDAAEAAAEAALETIRRKKKQRRMMRMTAA